MLISLPSNEHGAGGWLTDWRFAFLTKCLVDCLADLNKWLKRQVETNEAINLVDKKHATPRDFGDKPQNKDERHNTRQQKMKTQKEIFFIICVSKTTTTTTGGMNGDFIFLSVFAQ